MGSPNIPGFSELRAEMLKRVFFGGGAATGIAIIYGFVELLKSDPQDAFLLLKQWGPYFLIAMVAMYFAWDLGKRAVSSWSKLADGMQTLSAAVNRIAEKDDRQFEEMRLIVQYSARSSERTVELLSQHARSNEANQQQMQQQLAEIKQILGTRRRIGESDD